MRERLSFHVYGARTRRIGHLLDVLVSIESLSSNLPMGRCFSKDQDTALSCLDPSTLRENLRRSTRAFPTKRTEDEFDVLVPNRPLAPSWCVAVPKAQEKPRMLRAVCHYRIIPDESSKVRAKRDGVHDLYPLDAKKRSQPANGASSF